MVVIATLDPRDLGEFDLSIGETFIEDAYIEDAYIPNELRCVKLIRFLIREIRSKFINDRQPNFGSDSRLG